MVSIQRIEQPLFIFDAETLVFSNPVLRFGQPILQVYRCGPIWGLRLAQIGDFFLHENEIAFIPQKLDYFPHLHLSVLSAVLAFWMELRGLRTLHGASLKWKNQTFVLLADSTQGKSTLAASLLQRGASLLSDDISVIEASPSGFLARPGYASMRLGFEQLEHFLGAQAALAKRLPGLGKAIVPVGTNGWAQFEQDNQSPSHCYILERALPGLSALIEIQQLKPREAVIALVRHSFVHHSPFITATAAQRLEFLTSLISQLSVKRLSYPSGYENLDAVCAAIKRDLLLQHIS